MGTNKWAWGVLVFSIALGCGSGDRKTTEHVAQTSSAALTDCHSLPEWSVKTYGGGDRVVHGGSAYECKPFPFSGWCGQAGYEPGVTANWTDAWLKLDACASSGGSGGGSSAGGSSAGGASGSGAANNGTGGQITGYCPDNPAQCCPTGYIPVVLTPGADTFQTSTPLQCVVGLGGINTIAAQGGNHVVIGGPDTDIIQSANGNNFVVPGPGLDIVSTGVGDDTVYIFDLCELQFGETIDMGSGHNTLVAPLPLADLQARGLTIANVNEVIVQQNSCRSQCSAHPDCSGHGHCVEGATPGAMACACDTGFGGDQCNKDAIPDTDGDGTDDLKDGCPLDPHKITPGICDCGTSDELDSDLDGVPDCRDLCPHDPNNTYPGGCGCADQKNLQPAGTACTVEACSGSGEQGTCNALGQCGSPSCFPPQGCVFKPFKDSGYLICSGAVSWDQAEALCQQEPGRSLAEVDSRLENLWLASVAGDNAWLGGNDRVDDGRWAWSYDGARNRRPFWDNGLPIPSHFSNWHAGAPNNGQCLKLAKDGTWSDADCTETRGFVCEQPLRKLPPKLGPVCPCQFFPGVSCDSCGKNIPPLATPCVHPEVEFPHDHFTDAGAPDDEQNFIEARDMAQKCHDGCSGPNDTANCNQNCTGFAVVPPPGSCDPFTDHELAYCDLKAGTVVAGDTCSLANPVCPGGLTCGRAYDCAALDANLAPIRCTSDVDCGSDIHCNARLGYCIDPNRTAACDAKDAAGKCVNVCFSKFACGKPDPTCPIANEDTLIARCSLTEVCPDPGTTAGDTNPLHDPNSHLDPTPFPVDSIFPEPASGGPQPTPYELAKPDHCGGPGEPACDFGIGQHPWCQFRVDPQEAPVGKDLSDSQPPFNDKKGTGGGGGPIRFDFDPNLDISYNFGLPLALGDTRFGAHAQASATADAHFSLFGINGDVSILDALGSLDVDRCGFNNDAKLELFGIDFLPAVLGGEAEADLQAANTSPAERTTCENTLIAIQKLVNKSQKALRDAQELIRQEKELVANGQRFSPDLCQQLLEGPGKGLPANFPTPFDQFKGCNNLSPEDTVNLFVRYYKQQVVQMADQLRGLLALTTPKVPSVTIPFLDSIDDQHTDESRRETQQIANFNFLIGPIPMNLTVEAFVQYGVAGDLSFALTPDAIANTLVGSTNESLAAVDASFTPFAGAGVSVFLGVGFDFGPVSAKVGISGDVSLGLVTLPLYAGAGINVQAANDDRPLPDDLKDIVADGQMLYPPGLPKKFRFNAHYKFGVEAHIQDILQGTIYAKLRIKFFWFSKTWQKQIVRFDSPFPEFDQTLISGDKDLPFASGDLGFLGFIHMPVTFVNLAELDTPPALPPLPDPGTGGGGAGGGGNGAAGSTTGSGGRPPVSLLVQGDPRFKDFDPSRVDQLFYAGYCECTDTGSCESNLDCCGTNFCELDDTNGQKSCVTCLNRGNPVTGHGQVCTTASQCCDRTDKCEPLAKNGATYCQTCRVQDQLMTDFNNDGQPDFSDECCVGLHPFKGPVTDANGTVVTGAAAPTCLLCHGEGQPCNDKGDCCLGEGFECPNGTCEAVK